MPLSLQAKLLRVLETKAVIPVGSVKPRAVNFRLICASNVALAQCVKEGTFRMDLYYRLNVIPITIPPLRERREDITPLADYFLDHFCQKYGLQKEFSSRVYQILNHYKWPGNIRELRNLVEHMVVMSESSVVKINQIPTGMLQLEPPSPESGPECLNEEYLRIQMALRLHGGHREKTAQYCTRSEFLSGCNLAYILHTDNNRYHICFADKPSLKGFEKHHGRTSNPPHASPL